ncbi:uncharacterized protein hdly [Periplaneta americana]|uniref:uncharacterized protein hdly n=1 Tax=Periplaneta americana TaxID=6978 RepID=UPI0037E70E12
MLPQRLLLALLWSCHLTTPLVAIAGFWRGALPRQNGSALVARQLSVDDAPRHNAVISELKPRAQDAITFVDDKPARSWTTKPPNEVTSNAPPSTSLDVSRCVWAIVSCCSPGSDTVNHPCFEVLGCPGPFWDSNPCTDKMANAALKAAGDYYSSALQQN